MNLTITFSNDTENPRELITTRKIGQGKYEVFHAHDTSSSHEYAIKIFPNDKSSLARCKRERDLLETLDHPNIIKHHPAEFDGELGILVLDFENHGDFFDIVTKGGFANELHMRSYFRQLIEGLEYLHSKGIAHLDLKLENLLMGREFQLLLIDFDQSQSKEEERLVSGGTNSYRAPEIREKKCSNVFAADVYSAGVTLFAFKTGQFPFPEVEKERQTELEGYDLFVESNNDYWQMKTQKINKKADFFSEDFKLLLNGMLEKDPAKRITLQEIKASEWYNKPILSPEGLKFHMSRVLQRMKQ